MPKILFLIDQNPPQPVRNLLAGLAEKRIDIKAVGSDPDFIRQCREKNVRTKTIKNWPKLKAFLPCLAAWLLYPLNFILSLGACLLLKHKCKYQAVVCRDDFFSFLLPLGAKTAGIKMFYLGPPGPGKASPARRLLLKTVKNRTTYLEFSAYLAGSLHEKLGAKTKVRQITLGLPLNSKSQSNMFQSLADSNRKKQGKKFFSIGTVLDSSQGQPVEHLFRAAKICLNVIPNLQLIIIGQGREKHKLDWLAQRLEISSLVWFVGEHTLYKKWYENLDIYICTCAALNAKNLHYTLTAMAGGLPLIGPEEAGLEEILAGQKAGTLVPMDKDEALAEGIIRLYKNRAWRKQLGRNAKQLVEVEYNLDKMVSEFINIIYNDKSQAPNSKLQTNPKHQI